MPRIPSPSLEGYAKAAAYMPAAKLASQVQLRHQSPSLLRQHKPTQLLLFLAVVLPIALLARTIAMAYLDR